MAARAPWDRDDSASEVAAGFLGRHYESLGETSLASDASHCFSFGQTLALAHSWGMVHGDLHQAHMFFDPGTGQSMFIDWDAGRKIQVSAEACCTDFAPPAMSLTEEEFRAFLAGYLNVARTMVDLSVPGFSDALLARLGVTVADDARPRENSIDLVEVARRLGVGWRVANGHLTIVPGEVAGSANFCDEEPDRFLVIACGLLLARVDCAPILQGAAALGATTARGRGAVAMLRHALCLETVLGRGPDAQVDGESVAAAYLREIRQERDGRGDQDGGPVFPKCIKEFPDAQALQFGDELVDVVDALALFCVRRGDEAIRGSVGLAQTSTILLQMLFARPGEHEARFVTMLKRSNELGWPRKYLAPGDDGATFSALPYANSRCATLLAAFKSPPEGSGANARWSAVWRALQLSRHCIIATNRLLRAGENKDVPRDVLVQIAPSIMARHCLVLQAYFEGHIEFGKANMLVDLARGAKSLEKEISEAVSLYQMLCRTAATEPAARAQFESLSASLEDDRTYALKHMELR